MANEIAVEKQRGFKEYLFRDSNQNRMRMALPKHIRPDKMAAVAFTAMVRTPALFECSYESVLDSLLKLSQIGLIPDGRMAAIIPFKGVATAVPMYQGLVHLAYQSNMVAECFGSSVRANDFFEWEMGTTSFVKHRPLDGDRGELTHAWAMCKLSNGGAPFVVLNKSEVMAAKAASKSSGRSDSPWNNKDTEPAMWAKTAFRRLAKWIPQSPDLLAALQLDDEADGMGAFDDAQEVPAKRSKAPPLLPQAPPSLDASFDHCKDAAAVEETAFDLADTSDATALAEAKERALARVRGAK